jgi:autotransporter-associated beta strand protein
LTNLKAVRDDANVNFGNLTVTNAVTGLPNAGIATNTFSVRWLGKVLTPNSSGSYSFTTTTDDGARLWVNGTLVVDSWIDQGATARSGTITLAANTLYDIVMEYYQNGVAASAILSWTPPGGSLTVIPSSNLFLPGAGALVKTGAGTLNLSGFNTYTGPTIVGAGTLEISSANGLASPTVTVTNGATLKLDSATALNSQVTLIMNTNIGSPLVNLNYAGSGQIGQLSLDGGSTFTPGGTWGPVGSGAQHTSSRFIGSGLLNLGACSQTNSIVGITNNPNHTVTLTMQGTFGAQYYLVTQTNVTQPIANWQPVPGSTNQVSAVNGIWSLTVSNSTPTAVFRVKAVSSCF